MLRAMGETTTFLHERLAGGVELVTLNRPDQLNAFDWTMRTELRDFWVGLRDDSSLRCVIVTGAGRAFCSGADAGMLSEPRRPFGDGLDDEISLVPGRTLPVPVIAAVNGVAAGAGANIALACDLVIAARSANFVQAFSKIGLVPDCGGTWLLPRLVGNARALGLTLLAEKLPAQQAQEWGLIWRCVADEELMPTARALAAQLAAGPTRGFARTKEAIYRSWEADIARQLDLERDFQRELGASADYREGVAAFLEKRAARFTGA